MGLSLGAVRWDVGVCDADGVLVAWHRVVRIDDRAVAWSFGTADGVVHTVRLDDAADEITVAVWRGPASSSEPAPSGRRSVDELVRLGDGSAELADGRRPTIGACQRRVTELEQTGPATDDGRNDADADGAWSAVPYDDQGEPLVAPWLEAVREAREVWPRAT